MVVFLFGVLEIVFSVWENVGLGEYFNMKGIPVNGDGLSYMFYEPMLGYAKRMTSVLIDPISLGHFFATASIGIYYLYPIERFSVKSKYIYLAIALAGLILTFSKGALLQAYIGLVLFDKRINLFLRLILMMLPVVVVSMMPDQLMTGLLLHFHGTANAFESISLFGYGIGSVGNYSKMFSEDLSLYYQMGISDTFVGSIVGQIGLVGALIWLGLGSFLIFCYASNGKGFRVAMTMFISIFIVSIMSENTMNVTSFTLPALLIALCCRYPADKEDGSVHDDLR